ncbi:MAG: hypothetical protein IJY55_00735 [Clostridia bacterium]|nr:hypothetical protein [Clostridia bacterium]
MSNKFDDIIGQELIKSFLLTSIRRGKVSHAYVIEGDKGMGKKLIANTFAAYLVCDGKSSCGVCESCRLSSGGSHPDIITVLPEKKQIGVDDIRQVIKSISIKPYMADKKVVIIPDADGITKEAQNALLKVLEEPPEYVVFIILIQNAELLLDTILSRVMKLSLTPYTEADVKKVLGGESALIAASENNIGKALALSGDETYLEMRDNCLHQIENLIGTNQICIFDTVNFFEKNKDESGKILDIMLAFFRDIVFIKLGQKDLLGNKDKTESLVRLAEKTELFGAFKATQYITEAQKMHSRNVNYGILITALSNGCWEVLNGRNSRSSF